MPATYKITMHTSWSNFGNEFLNVFGYHDQLALPVAMSELVNHFESDIIPDIAAVLNENSFITRVECEQVIGGSNYIDHILDPVVQGERTGEYLPIFNAWGFTYQRAAHGERSGSKRFGLVSETDVVSGAASGPIVALLNTLATTLFNPISIGLVETWFPIILERPPVVDEGPPIVYGPWGFHDLAGVIYKRVTTQNTRKR